MTVPVTGERRDIGRLDSRRAVRRARFAIAAPMPAFVPSSSQRRGQLLLDQLFNEAPDPIRIPVFIGSDQAPPRNSFVSSTVVVLSVVMA